MKTLDKHINDALYEIDDIIAVDGDCNHEIDSDAFHTYNSVSHSITERGLEKIRAVLIALAGAAELKGQQEAYDKFLSIVDSMQSE